MSVIGNVLDEFYAMLGYRFPSLLVGVNVNRFNKVYFRVGSYSVRIAGASRRGVFVSLRDF